MYWIGAIVAISVLIIVHEAGHYIVAKWCKMRVDRFSLGFGPALLSKKYKGTQFQVAPIPFGGFVEIRGMNIAEEIDDDDPYAYPNRPAWQRFATIFAGPATNYLFAIVLAFALFTCAGVPTGTSWYLVDEVEEGYDAKGKLEYNDRILAVNGTPVYRTLDGERPADDETMQALVDTPEPVVVTVLRGGEELDVTITPTYDEDLKDPKTGEPAPRHRVGIRMMWQQERKDVGVVSSVGHAFYYPVEQTKVIVQGLYKIVVGEEKGELRGPVGIADFVKKAIEIGWITALQLLMVLNVYLGMFNLFPLPALDGGRLVFLTYEMATRRRANPKIEATVHMVGIMALLLLMVAVTYSDCARLF